MTSFLYQGQPECIPMMSSFRNIHVWMCLHRGQKAPGYYCTNSINSSVTRHRGSEIDEILTGHRSQGPATKSPGQCLKIGFFFYQKSIFRPLNVVRATQELVLILGILNQLPTDTDILTKSSGSHTIFGGATKPKFRRVGHRSQGATN